jgi:RNA polymerase sigma-70 factor (ECF subfamily)
MRQSKPVKAKPIPIDRSERRPDESDKNERVLVIQARDGDRRATEQLVRRYQDRAFAVAYRMCAQDREEALELTQEAFLAALRNLKNFQGKSSFYTWFYRILVNTCLDARRRKIRWKRLFPLRRTSPQSEETDSQAPDQQPDPEDTGNPDKNLQARELHRNLQKAMELLTDRQRMAFQLKVYEEMTIGEIARAMDLAEGSVKSHLFRATRILREALADWADDRQGEKS